MGAVRRSGESRAGYRAPRPARGSDELSPTGPKAAPTGPKAALTDPKAALAAEVERRRARPRSILIVRAGIAAGVAYLLAQRLHYAAAPVLGKLLRLGPDVVEVPISAVVPEISPTAPSLPAPSSGAANKARASTRVVARPASPGRS